MSMIYRVPFQECQKVESRTRQNIENDPSSHLIATAMIPRPPSGRLATKVASPKPSLLLKRAMEKLGKLVTQLLRCPIPET